MPPNVVNGAMLTCSFGLAPSTLAVLPTSMVMIDGQPAATTMDHVPLLNIQPFGMCSAPSNPTVAAATAAAAGVLTPMPCIPATSAPWVPGAPMTQLGGMSALTSGSQCLCNWGGVIQITMPGSTTTQSS